MDETVDQKLEQLVKELTCGFTWPWTRALSCQDAANMVLRRMVELGIIQGRPHPYSSATYAVYKVNGKLFGRTEGVDPNSFNAQ